MVEISEDDKISANNVFNPCESNQHDRCNRIYRRFYIDPKNRLIWLPEVVMCACKKRGCKCYTKPADRPKPVKKRAPRRKK